MSHLHKMVFVNLYVHLILYLFLDLAVAKSLQVFRMVTDDADVLTTTGYTGPYTIQFKNFATKIPSS